MWTSLIAQLVKSTPAMKETRFNSWVRKIHWRRDRLPTPVFLGFPGGSDGKESACNAGDLGLILWLGRSPGEGKGYPLQYSRPWTIYIVHEVAKSWTRLSDFQFSSQQQCIIGAFQMSTWISCWPMKIPYSIIYYLISPGTTLLHTHTSALSKSVDTLLNTVIP